MGDAEAFGDQPVARLDHVAIAVMREFAPEAVRRLRRSAAADRVLHDDEIVPRIERLARPEQLVGERGAQPVRPGPGIALQQQDAVDDLAPASRRATPIVR